jgi:hypothetical protein
MVLFHSREGQATPHVSELIMRRQTIPIYRAGKLDTSEPASCAVLDRK